MKYIIYYMVLLSFLLSGTKIFSQNERIKPAALKNDKDINDGATNTINLVKYNKNSIKNAVPVLRANVKTTAGVSSEITAGWDTIMSEDFENSFPGPKWDILSTSGYTDAYWAKQNYRKYNGNYSGWCAGAGSECVSPGSNYPNNMNSWVVYGPFDLNNADEAKLTFMFFNNTELNYDYFGWLVSTNDENYSGYSYTGNSNGWRNVTLDFKNDTSIGNLMGNSNVWIAFVFQSDGANNNEGAYIDDIVIKKAAWPDLKFSSLALNTDSWVVGDSVTLDLAIVNNGIAPAGSQYSRIYLSSDTIITSSDRQIGTSINFNPISAGGSQIQRMKFKVPDITDGPYYIGTLIDYPGAVTELNETNNKGRYSGQITIVHHWPDLKLINMVSNNDNWPVGDSIVIGLTAKNYGNSLAGEQYTRLYLSEDSVITSADILVGSDISFSSIYADSSQMLNIKLVVPDITDGTYYLGTIIDYYNNVAESDESNNKYRLPGKITITHLLPDLEWTLIQWWGGDYNWKVGNTITIDLTVKNNGNAPAGEQYSRMYLSADINNFSSYVQLGSDIYFDSIGIDTSQVKRTSFEVPDINKGAYYLVVYVDLYEDIIESSETNNGNYAANKFTIIPKTSNIKTNEIGENSDYLIYPNPTSDWITIESSMISYSITIYSLEGKIMITKPVNESLSNIDLSFLTNGVYIIKLEDSHNIIIKKIIKQ